MMDIKIETIYKTRIEFSFDNNWLRRDGLCKSEKVCKYSCVLARNYTTIKMAYSAGGPAWYPYMEIEGPIKADVLCAAKDLCTYIKRFKGHHIEL